MIKENVKKLFEKIQKDQQSQKKYAGIMQNHGMEAEKTLAEKLIEFGKNAGFNFSKDDLMAAKAELIDKNNSGSELSEKDLSAVAGGDAVQKVQFAFATLTAFGLACAVIVPCVSIDAQRQGINCDQALSLTVNKC